MNNYCDTKVVKKGQILKSNKKKSCKYLKYKYMQDLQVPPIEPY